MSWLITFVIMSLTTVSDRFETFLSLVLPLSQRKKRERCTSFCCLLCSLAQRLFERHFPFFFKAPARARLAVFSYFARYLVLFQFFGHVFVSSKCDKLPDRQKDARSTAIRRNCLESTASSLHLLWLPPLRAEYCL